VIESYHHCINENQARQLLRAIAEYARDAEQTSIAVIENRFYLAEREELLRKMKEILGE